MMRSTWGDVRSADGAVELSVVVAIVERVSRSQRMGRDEDAPFLFLLFLLATSLSPVLRAKAPL